jgi:quinol monooxygenase YgiN
VVFINRLQPADGKRDALIGLLREVADSINADPERLHYSVHEPIDDEATPLTVIVLRAAPGHGRARTLDGDLLPGVRTT